MKVAVDDDSGIILANAELVLSLRAHACFTAKVLASNPTSSPGVISRRSLSSPTARWIAPPWPTSWTASHQPLSLWLRIHSWPRSPPVPKRQPTPRA